MLPLATNTLDQFHHPVAGSTPPDPLLVITQLRKRVWAKYYNQNVAGISRRSRKETHANSTDAMADLTEQLHNGCRPLGERVARRVQWHDE